MTAKLLVSCAALGVLGACATSAPEPIDPNLFTEAQSIEPISEPKVRIVERVRPLPMEGQIKRVLTTRTITRTIKASADQSPEETIKTGRTAALIEPSADGYLNAVQIYPYTEGSLYRLYASPGQVTDIALQKGESLVSVSAGDTVRWVVGDTRSGEGANERAHILVKPVSAGITTNLMIATNRRTYHLELESVDGGYMAALSWRYPADELKSLTQAQETRRRVEAAKIDEGLDLDALNFDYRVSGDKPDWRPVQVFDDGRQVFIQMPDAISTTDLPPLFVVGRNNRAELINYRVKGRYYVVDGLFRVAELRHGEKNQSVVRITRGKPGLGLSALLRGGV